METSFIYQNHRGEVARRDVLVEELVWLDQMPADYEGEPIYQPGWYIVGIDVARNARRSFALSHVVLPKTRGDGYRLMQLGAYTIRS